MAVAQGYGKTVTSGSVFAYDVADTRNSYIGEPIDNIWSDSYGQSVNNVGSWSAPMQSTAGLTQSVRSETWNGNRIWQLERTAGNAGTYDSWRRCVDQPLAGSYPSTRFVTMKICTPFDDPVSELALHTGGGNSSHNSSTFTKIPINEVPKDAPYRDKWYEFHISANWSSTTVGHCVGLAFISGNASTFLATEPMYYASTHKIPFTPTDRSSTQGLLPLVGNSTIDLSNVSFDSNAQMTFDGTDDILNTGLFSGRNPSTDPFTVEAILKSNTTSGAKMWIDATSNGSNQRFYSSLDDGGNNPMGIQGTGWTDTNPSTTNYIHQIIVMDGSTARSYRNGSATYTRSYTSYTLIGPLKIGGRSSYNWNGEIPVVKIYNRALSAAEVKQNYLHYKTRFNLS